MSNKIVISELVSDQDHYLGLSIDTNWYTLIAVATIKMWFENNKRV